MHQKPDPQPKSQRELHSRTLSGNLSGNLKNPSIYCTCKNTEKKSWLQNYCNKCNKQINHNKTQDYPKTLEKNPKVDRSFLEKNESLRKIYDFIQENPGHERNPGGDLSTRYIEQDPFKEFKEELEAVSWRRPHENDLSRNISFPKGDKNENLEFIKRRLNEVEKSLGKGNEILWTPDIKMLKSKTTHQKSSRNPSPAPKTQETAKKTNATPSPYNKSVAHNSSQSKLYSPNQNYPADPHKLNPRNDPNNPHKHSKTLINYQKHLIANKETSKTLVDLQRLPLEKLKKNADFKSKTSRPLAENNEDEGYLQRFYAGGQNGMAPYSMKQPNSDQNRAKSALRYKPGANNEQYPNSSNRSFYNNAKAYYEPDFQADQGGSLDQASSSDDLIKYKKPYRPGQNPSHFREIQRNEPEEYESLEYSTQNNSLQDYRDAVSQARLVEKKEKISRSETNLARNIFPGNNRVEDSNSQNKGYLLNFEHDTAVDPRNLSIDEKLSTKKIHKMLNKDYKFFQKPSENPNYKYEVPENERFQRFKAQKPKELKKAAAFPMNEVIKERTEENVVEITENSLRRMTLDSVKERETASKADQFTGLELKFVRGYKGHRNSINGLAYDPEGNKLWSCSHDYSLKIWDVRDFDSAKTRVFDHEIPICSKSWVWTVNYEHLNRVMISGGADRLIRIWNPLSLQQVACLKGHSAGVICLEQWSESLLVSGSGDESIKIWDISKGELINSYHEHRQRVTTIRKTEEENSLLVSGSFDRTLKGWDLRKDKSVFSYKIADDAITGIMFLDENRVLSTSLDKSLKIVDLRNGITTFSLELGSEIHCVERLGAVFLLGTTQIECFDPLSHSLKSMTPHPEKSSITKILWIPELQKIMAASKDASIKEYMLI